MEQNRSASLRLRPAPIVPPSSESTILKFGPLNNNSTTSSHVSSISSSASGSSSKSKKSSHKHKRSAVTKSLTSPKSSKPTKSKPSSSVSTPTSATCSKYSYDSVADIPGTSHFQVAPFNPEAASLQNAALSSYQLNPYQNYQASSSFYSPNNVSDQSEQQCAQPQYQNLDEGPHFF